MGSATQEVAPGITDKALDIPFVVALPRTAIAIADQVVGQEPAEQRRPLACAVGQDLCHPLPGRACLHAREGATVVVIDDQLRHGPEEGERVDVAIHPGLGHRRRIGPHIASITMRQIQNEEAGLLLDAADHHSRLAEVGLRVSGRMRQRHEHLLPTLIPLAHVILDDRVAAGEPAFVAQAVEHPLGGMALLARHLQILIKPMLDRRNECIQLRSPDR